MCVVRIEGLYSFLNYWFEDIYGELDEKLIDSKGFELIKHINSSIDGVQEDEKKNEKTQKLAYVSTKVRVFPSSQKKKILLISFKRKQNNWFYYFLFFFRRKYKHRSL